MDDDSESERPNQQDYAELYIEREWRLLEALQRVSRGLAGEEEALYLASELGLTTEFKEVK